MNEKKRFYKAYCCGDTGVVDKVENEWFIENIYSISDIEKNWDTVIDKLNKQEKTIKELNQYCIACDDTLTTIIELVDELLSMTTINHTLISKALKAIHNVDLKEMNQVKCEILKINGKI